MELNITTTQEQDIEWQNWYEGDEYSISCTSIRFNEERKAFYLINDTDSVGTSVYATNPENSKYPDATPHGIRLANALCKLFSITGATTTDTLLEQITAHIEANDCLTVSVGKNAKNHTVWTCA